MIGYWHTIPGPSAMRVRACREAHVGGCELFVERCSGEPAWRWHVVNARGHELECGMAPDIRSAEQQAEEAAFHIHPPSVGDWVARLL